MSGNGPNRLISLVTRAAVTLLIAAAAAYIGWWLLRQLLVPAIIVLALLGVYRIALHGPHRNRF